MPHLPRLTGQRRIREPVEVDAGQVLQQRVQVSYGPGSECVIESFAEFLRGQTACGVVLPEQRGNPVPVRVGCSDIGVIWHVYSRV